MFNGAGISLGVFDHEVNGYKGIVATRIVWDLYELDKKLGLVGGGGFDYRFDTTPIGFLETIVCRPNSPTWGKEFKKLVAHNYNRTVICFGHTSSLPVPTNSISLDPTVKDAWGVPAIRMTFQDHPQDLKLYKYFADRGEEMLKASGATQTWQQPVESAEFSVHLLGTCRMGNDPKSSVVDKYNRAHDVKNLFIVDGSSLVTCGRGQPTMTIQALGVPRRGQHQPIREAARHLRDCGTTELICRGNARKTRIAEDEAGHPERQRGICRSYRTMTADRLASLGMTIRPLPPHLENENVRPMIVARDVERHALFAHAVEIEIRVEHRRLVVHRTGEVRAVGRDDRAAAAHDPRIRARHFRRMRLELGRQRRRAHHRSRGEHVAATLERILPARHLVHLVHRRPERDVHVFARLVHRVARERHPMLPAHERADAAERRRQPRASPRASPGPHTIRSVYVGTSLRWRLSSAPSGPNVRIEL